MKKKIFILTLILVVITASLCIFIPINKANKENNEYARNLFIVSDNRIVGVSLKNITEITIPEKIDGLKITSIGPFAFDGCTSLTKIVIPKTITYIDPTFLANKKTEPIPIKEISVSKLNKYYSSSNNVLYNKDKTHLLAYAYGNGETSFTIPEGVTHIGDYAFYRSNLTSINMPSTLTHIGSYAFPDLIDFPAIPDSVNYIGHDAFTLLSVSDEYKSEKDGLTYYGTQQNPYFYLFSEWDSDFKHANIDPNCKIIDSVSSEIESTNIPEGVLSISSSAFYNCKSLKSIKIPNSITSIGDSAFFGCSALTSIEIPESITSIPNSAFADCNALENVTLPNSITSIDLSAFNFNDNLNYTTENGFYYLGNKENPYLYLHKHEPIDYRAKERKEEKTINAQCKIINRSALYNHFFITIDKENQYFSSLNGALYTKDKSTLLFYPNYSDTTNIEIPEGVKTIKSSAFSSSLYLEVDSLKLPKSLTLIENGALSFDVKEIIISNRNPVYSVIDGCLYNKNKTHFIKYVAKEGVTSFTIPRPVTLVGTNAFCRNCKLETIKTQNTVRQINSSAFDIGPSSIYIAYSVIYMKTGAVPATSSLTVYCETYVKPDGWDYFWWGGTSTSSTKVKWGCPIDY